MTSGVHVGEGPHVGGGGWVKRWLPEVSPRECGAVGGRGGWAGRALFGRLAGSAAGPRRATFRGRWIVDVAESGHFGPSAWLEPARPKNMKPNQRLALRAQRLGPSLNPRRFFYFSPVLHHLPSARRLASFRRRRRLSPLPIPSAPPSRPVAASPGRRSRAGALPPYSGRLPRHAADALALAQSKKPASAQ